MLNRVDRELLQRQSYLQLIGPTESGSDKLLQAFWICKTPSSGLQALSLLLGLMLIFQLSTTETLELT